MRKTTHRRAVRQPKTRTSLLSTYVAVVDESSEFNGVYWAAATSRPLTREQLAALKQEARDLGLRLLPLEMRVLAPGQLIGHFHRFGDAECQRLNLPEFLAKLTAKRAAARYRKGVAHA